LRRERFAFVRGSRTLDEELEEELEEGGVVARLRFRFPSIAPWSGNK
jgi:hypothetical protein